MTNIVDPRQSMPPDFGPRPPLHVRNMDMDDIAAGLRLCRASRWNQVESDWLLFLTLNPNGSLVAVAETGEIVGSVATLRYGDAFTWIAMVLVDPSRRRNGIGTRLLDEALILSDDGPTVRLDATPAGYEVYVRNGFCEEYRLQRMERAPLPPHAAEVATGEGATPGEPARPTEDGDVEQILQRDREVFGADRAPLLEAFRRRAPEYAWVVGGDQIDGYVVGRHGHNFDHIGPLVARDEDTARRLVLACLSAHPDRPLIIDVPRRGSWTRWLESIQFAVQRPFIRMYRGERRYRERPDWMFAIAGPEFG